MAGVGENLAGVDIFVNYFFPIFHIFHKLPLYHQHVNMLT